MRNRRKFELSSIDMTTFLIISLLGVRLLTLPRDLAGHTKLGAWVSVLIGTATIFILSFMMYWLGIKHPEKNGSEIVLSLYGKFLGPLGILLISINTLGAAGLGMRLFEDTIKMYLLPQTPSMVIAMVMLGVAFYTFNLGLKVITSLINILIPPVLLSIIFIMLLPLSRVDAENFMNPFGLGILPVFEGSLEVLDALYGFTLITYLMPYFKERESVKRWVTVGISIPSIIYFNVVLLCILVFGDAEMGRMLYPTVTLAKSI
ncbi:GerAB/ArcD/ProY family transporter [Clostridiaceae bacterium 35-E11]